MHDILRLHGSQMAMPTMPSACDRQAARGIAAMELLKRRKGTASRGGTLARQSLSSLSPRPLAVPLRRLNRVAEMPRFSATVLPEALVC